LCREHGRQIVQLAADLDRDDNITLPYWGIVKEIDADPTGLAEFQELYFNRAPLYRDVELKYYEAFGKQKINMLPYYNPFKLYQWFRTISNRMKSQNIDGNLKGEGLIKGGLLIFVKGELKYAEDEPFGEPLNTEALKQVIQQVYRPNTKKKQPETSTTASDGDDAGAAVVKDEL
jgi:AhpC/TSA antioxidant enzyme